jgi:hypothetical protein
MFDAIEEMKTEGRCTNVTRGNGKSDPTPQADYEVKRKEAYDEDCPAGEHEHED